MTIDTLLAFGSIVFFLAVIPGPNALLILFTALTQGRSQALANIVGVAVGFLVHAFISAKGLSLLLAQSTMAFSIFKWVGVLYLIWLGITNLRSGFRLSKTQFQPTPDVRQRKLGESFRKGLLTNLLNPKIVLFYLSIFPHFVPPEHLLQQSLVLGALQAVIVASWFIFLIIFATRVKSFLTTPKTSKWLNYISGVLFISFGLGLANSRL